MKAIICDKCKKPVNIKDVRHIVVRTEETEHVFKQQEGCPKQND